MTRTFASPLARTLARRAGATLTEIEGTGPGGRIIRRDVEAWAARGRLPAVMPANSAVVQSLPVPAQLRRTVRIDALLELCQRLIEPGRPLITVDDLLVKAVGQAHALVPRLIGRRGAGAHVAVVMSAEPGAAIPVLRDVDARSVSSVAAGLAELRESLVLGTFRRDDQDGAPVSIINLGRYGIEEFAGSVEPPLLGALAVGAASPEPVVADGRVAVATVVRCTLSIDPGAVDLASAAEWFEAFGALVENPVRILA